MKQRAYVVAFAALLLFSGCNETNSSTVDSLQSSRIENSQSDPTHSSQTESAGDASSLSGDQNFLGGKGELQIIDTRNSLCIEDDEWFYLGRGKVSKSDKSAAQMVLQCRVAGCSHNSSDCIISKFYSGGNMLLSDGNHLYVAKGNDLFKIGGDGNDSL